MKLRNKKGIERNFRILFEFNSKNKRYIIYKDINTLNIYGGRVDKDVLKPLDEKEFTFINNLIEKMNS